LRNRYSISTKVLNDARSRGLHIVIAESCTGGLVAGALTEIAGASDVVDCGFVVYTNEAKSQLLGVPPALIARHGAVSAEVARALAEGALAHSFAHASIAVTGIAGPSGGSPEKPVGLVHIAAARQGRDRLIEEHRFGDIGREQVRLKSVEAALKLLSRVL